MEFNTLTTTLTNFITVFQAGFTKLMPSITSLMRLLLGIEVVLLGCYWALGGGERVAAVIKKLLFLCFWIWLVQNFASLSSAFVDSLVQAGAIAGGGKGGTSLLLDPSRIAGYGLDATDILAKKLQNTGRFAITDQIIFGLSYIMIMLTFLVIAIQAFLTVLEYYLMMALSGIFIPFGFISSTKFLAEKAIGAVVSSGVKMMVLSFLLAVVEPVLANIKISPDCGLNEIWAVLLTTSSLAFLAWHAPGMAAGLLAGSPSLSASAASQNTMATMMVGGAATAHMIHATRSAAGAFAGKPQAQGSAVAAGASMTSSGAKPSSAAAPWGKAAPAMLSSAAGASLQKQGDA